MILRSASFRPVYRRPLQAARGPAKRSDAGSTSRPLLGVAGKLYAALSLLAGMTVCASVVAWWGFGKIEQAVEGVTSVAIPNLAAAHALASASADIAATAPAIAASRNQAARIRVRRRLRLRQQHLQRALDDLVRQGQSADAIAALAVARRKLEDSLSVLDEAVEHRIRLAAQRQASIASLARDLPHFEETLEPLVDDAMFDLVIAGERLSADGATQIAGLVDRGVGEIDSLLGARADAHLAFQLLIEAVHTTDWATIETIRERFATAAGNIVRNLELLPGGAAAGGLQRAVDRFVSFGRPPLDVFQHRLAELRIPGDGAAFEIDWPALARQLAAAHEALVVQLTPMIDDAAFDLVLGTEKVVADGSDAIAELIGGGATELYLLLLIQAEGILAAGLLNQAALTDDSRFLGPIKERFGVAAERIDDARQRLSNPAARSLISEGAGPVLRHAGPDNLIDLRVRELQQVARAESALETSRMLSVELADQVGALVASAQRQSAGARQRADATIRQSGYWLLTISVAVLAGSAFVMVSYVRRQIIVPLGCITAAMMRLAGGDTSADIPYRRNTDEIGHMARSLGVFRDTALEVQRSNLKEIERARRRLSDAIESISEAFSLYDAEERLVICNSKYPTLLYAGTRQRIVPGMTFESIVRAAAESGMIVDAVGRVDDWVTERLERHKDPGEPHVQKRADGRWIMVSERKTAEGGTVAVYTDISELKQRESDLADKSRSLEHLSGRLAKYLSPQVYESIFAGKQEVSLTSKRRRLTVFFSDIAGFTETADRLESESLTELLNHYLSEMAQIALDHGATIDKYVGDAILVFFGDPESRGARQDAVACVRMAVAMQAKMHELETVWRNAGIERPLRCRMGINTGFCTVGNFGSERRMDYTIIGSGVNLASRLESVCAPGEILLSYETYALVKDEIACQPRGEIAVRGLAYPVATYAVLGGGGDRGAPIEEVHPHLNLVLDPQAMAAAEREEMAHVLRRALRRLSGDADRP